MSITQQPTSVASNFTEMPIPVMGGGTPVGFIPEVYPPLCPEQRQVGSYHHSSNQGQHVQTIYNGQNLPQPQMGMDHIGYPSFHSQNNVFLSSGSPGLTRAPQDAPLISLPPREGIPFGLQILADMNEIVVKQKTEFLEKFSTYGNVYEYTGSYDIANSKGEKIYFARESKDFADLCCGGPHRPFLIPIVDLHGNTVLLVERPCDWPLYITNCWACCCCWFGIIGGKATVRLVDGTLLGMITHKFGCYAPKYELTDSKGNVVMYINGPQCGDCCLCQDCLDVCCSTKFPVTMTDGIRLGSINKKWGGFSEFITDADTFGVNFPLDLDIKWKAIILGAVFLLDFMYYDEGRKKRGLMKQTAKNSGFRNICNC